MTPDTPVSWKKSSYSQTDWREQCVEIGTPAGAAHRHVRDSVHPDGPALALGADTFAALVGAIRTGAL